MDRNSRVRWTILLCALGLTLIAIVYPSGEHVIEPRPRPRKPAVREATPPMAPPVRHAVSGDRANVDPFAPREWTTPAPEPEATVAPVVVASVEPAPPPGPPNLPFTFVGRMSDGGSDVVYLSLGDQTLVVQRGDTLQNTYKVQDVRAHEIEFVYMPTGEIQTLALPADN